ncbi:hypothetical protein Golob_025305 [Gossypium lobatum]|uniref:Uncharacterized protein n=1 Tax=Gossypium lobatum TaxID=34289 RepID=A0A7J8NKI7_9ROSI|nr:hypothetical protein [Gossypium lobatum]
MWSIPESFDKLLNLKEKFLKEDHLEITQPNHLRGMKPCVVQLDLMFQTAKPDLLEIPRQKLS